MGNTYKVPVRERDIIQEARRYAEQKAILVNSLINKGNFLNENGCPTKDAITIVKEWSYNDPKGWFAFIKSIWHFESWGSWEEGFDNENPLLYRYELSTADWTGNESIISAMKKNQLSWRTTWVQSHRDGHHVFEWELYK